MHFAIYFAQILHNYRILIHQFWPNDIIRELLFLVHTNLVCQIYFLIVFGQMVLRATTTTMQKSQKTNWTNFFANEPQETLN